MIQLTRLNGVKYYLNDELIEYIEQIPDTLITLQSGKHLNVMETPQEVLEKIVAYRRRLYIGLPTVNLTSENDFRMMEQG